MLTAEVSYEELYKQAEQENGPVKTLTHLCGDDLERGNHARTCTSALARADLRGAVVTLKRSPPARAAGVLIDLRQRFLRHVRLEYEEMFSKVCAYM